MLNGITVKSLNMNNENVYEIVLNNDLDNILSKKFANNLSEKLEFCVFLSKFKLHVYIAAK